MKRVIAALALCAPLLGHAEVMALNFNAVPLISFVQATYRTMLKRDYVLSPELLAMEKPISVSVRNISTDALPKFVERILYAQGIRSVERDGVYFLSVDSPMGGAPSGGKAFSLSGPYVPPVSVEGAPLSSRPVLDMLRGGLAGGRDLQSADAGFDDDRMVFLPQNRKSDFFVSVLNTVYSSKPAHAAANLVVLSGPKDRLQKMLELCKSLDFSAHKIKVSATFVEVSTSSADTFGVSVVGNVLGAEFGVKIGDPANGSLSLKGRNFQAVLDAIASDGRFKQVATPTAILDDYEKSNLSFGDSVPTISGSSFDKNGNAISQVVYHPSGVLLDVTPRVLGSGRINITVDGQVSSFSATTTGVTGSPTLSKRQVQTTVTVDDGEILIIGGMNNNRTTESRSGFSFLPKSWALQNGSTTSTDLVLVLTASVVK